MSIELLVTTAHLIHFQICCSVAMSESLFQGVELVNANGDRAQGDDVVRDKVIALYFSVRAASFRRTCMFVYSTNSMADCDPVYYAYYDKKMSMICRPSGVRTARCSSLS